MCAVAAVVSVGGCTALLGIDNEYGLVDGGASGTGAVGQLGEPCMKVQELACGGNAQKLQLICGTGRTWEKNDTCPENTFCDTAMGADQGTCKSVVAECAGKSPGDVVCAGVTRAKCGPDLVTSEAVETCPSVCSAGACVVLPNCAGLPPTCGPSGNESCCASSVVAGGTYNRSNSAAYPATVSDFRLDRFEITVGRFRKFMASYPMNKPVAGAGAHPLIAESGWEVGWDASLAVDQAALKAVVKCSSTYQTWTDMAGGNENKPMNCMSWYEAFAFCAWDGGRLATEAEWNYAAAGGNEQRAYPWSNPPNSMTIDGTYAVYDGAGLGGVGSKSPKGDGKWGQADLAGGVWEWNLDWYGDPYAIQCNDCAIVIKSTSSIRVVRGGSWYNNESNLLSSVRLSYGPTGRLDFVGARCARTP